MPTYDYRCRKCGHTCEVFQSITDAPLKQCPSCGKNGLKRLIGAGAALIFRGSGFYCTDYRKTGASTPASSSKPSAGDGSAPKPPEAPDPSKARGPEAPGASKGSPHGKKAH